MTWQHDNRAKHERQGAEWSLLRVRVLRRDAYKCQAVDSTGRKCEMPANQVDHIVPNDDNSLVNLQALCKWHHDRKTAGEGNAARRPRAKQQRDPEPHPGLIQ